MNQLISIVIPLYNADEFLEETIQAVFKQTYSNFEIIAVNDGSKDNSLELLKELRKKDDRLCIIDKKNEGVSVARNIGIENAKGSLICFLDADDVWYSNKLSAQLQMLEKSDLGWCISNCDTISEKGLIIERNISKAPSASPHFNELITWTSPSFVAMSSLMVKRDFLSDIRYNPKISSPADKDFMIKLAKKGDAVYISESLWQYRILENSMSRNNIKVVKDMFMQYKCYENDFYGSQTIKLLAIKRLYYIAYRAYLKEYKIMSGIQYFYKYFMLNFNKINKFKILLFVQNTLQCFNFLDYIFN
jgi:teichuronic acid biosynthesis glycosyltransferase TuaG